MGCVYGLGKSGREPAARGPTVGPASAGGGALGLAHPERVEERPPRSERALDRSGGSAVPGRLLSEFVRQDLALGRGVGHVRLGVHAEELVGGGCAETVVDPQSTRFLGGDRGELSLVGIERPQGLGGRAAPEGQCFVRPAQPEGRGPGGRRSARVPPGPDGAGKVDPQLGMRGGPSLLVREVLEQNAPVLGPDQTEYAPAT